MSTELGEYCQLEVFHASCAPGHVVMMTSAVYGRMRIGRCVKQDYGFIGCSADVLRFADRLCSGRQICQFPVADLHGNQPCPDDLTPFLEASYRCVPGNCKTAFTPGHMSPGNMYPGRATCIRIHIRRRIHVAGYKLLVRDTC